jgi:hypothetical protein
MFRNSYRCVLNDVAMVSLFTLVPNLTSRLLVLFGGLTLALKTVWHLHPVLRGGLGLPLILWH